MLATLALALASTVSSADFPAILVAVEKRCSAASKKPSSKPYARLAIEKFDECIVEEANKRPLPLRKAICALGKSGGEYGSPVEVYMASGRCRTDYE